MSTRANQTIVRNISGGTKFFSFLGEHGTSLADGAYTAIAGNAFDRLWNSPIKSKAFKYALDNKLIEIVQTPHAFFYDSVTFKPYRVGSASGTIAATDPDYGSYTGSNTNPNPPNNP